MAGIVYDEKLEGKPIAVKIKGLPDAYKARLFPDGSVMMEDRRIVPFIVKSEGKR